MTWALLVLVTAITVGSRLAPMTWLPAPDGRLADVLDAIPAPLFAALAVVALVGTGDGGAPDAPVWFAAAGALVGAVRRSLLSALGFGVAGFVLAQLLLG